ncbi:hypothetical protein [Streptomyces sp. H62]
MASPARSWSKPTSMVSSAVLTYGLLGVRVSEHAAELARLHELAVRDRGQATT